MSWQQITCTIAVLLAALGFHSASHADEHTLSFNVLNHRGVTLTAHYWNPILTYVTHKTGIPLELKQQDVPGEHCDRGDRGLRLPVYEPFLYARAG